MTPIHGVPRHGKKSVEDSDSNLEAQPDPQAAVTREGLKLAILRHKDECDLHEKVDKLRLWVAGASVVGFIATVAAPIVLGWWLSTRLPAPSQHRAESPAFINQAHAETKGSP